MSEQQNTTPPEETTPPAGNSRGSRSRADAKPPAPEEPAAVQEDGGVKLYRGEGDARETVTAFKPSTVTRLKSEGWMPVEDEDA